jgi:hypothetical protein
MVIEMVCICGGDAIIFDDWFNIRCANCGFIIAPEGEFGVSYPDKFYLVCEYKGCNREAVTVLVVQDLVGCEYNRLLCKFHLKKILHDVDDVDYKGF